MGFRDLFKPKVDCERFGTLLAEACFTMMRDVPESVERISELVGRRGNKDYENAFILELYVLLLIFYRVAIDMFGPSDPGLRTRIRRAFDEAVTTKLDKSLLEFVDRRYGTYARLIQSNADVQRIAMAFAQFCEGREDVEVGPVIIGDFFDNYGYLMAVEAKIEGACTTCRGVFQDLRLV